MVEEIPLALVVHDAVVVGPAVGVLGHDETFVFVGSHGILAHGVAEDFCLFADVRIGEVVPAVSLEGKRSLSLAVGQVLEAVDAHHFELALTKLDFFFWSVVGQFLHVWLQLGATARTPKDVGVAIGGLEHAGVNAIDSLDGLGLGDEWSFGTVGNGHTDTETKAFFRGRGEIKIVLATALNAVGCPHGIGVGAHPGHLVLGDDDTVVDPVGKVLAGEDVVVLHAEPVLTLSDGRLDVVRRVKIHLVIKHASRRVGRKLVADDRVLCHDRRSSQAQPEC